MSTLNLPRHEEYLRKKRKRRFIIAGAISFSFFLVVGLLSYISHRKEFRINRVILFGGILVKEEDVEAKALSFMNGSYFWLFPKNNAFVYPKDDLENYLKENFKRIDTIDIQRKGFEKLSIIITERKHFAIWCKELPKANPEDEECYFMDKNSTVFAPAPNFSGDAYFKYYGLITNNNPLGLEYISSSTKFLEISDFVVFVKSLSIRPLYIVSKADGDFAMKLPGGAEIFFDLKEPLSKTSENLSLLFNTAELKNLNRSNLPLEYIDLRFGNKLYYKLKGVNTE